MIIIIIIWINDNNNNNNNNNNNTNNNNKNFFVPSKVGLYNCSVESESKSEMQTFELMVTVKRNKNNRRVS